MYKKDLKNYGSYFFFYKIVCLRIGYKCVRKNFLNLFKKKLFSFLVINYYLLKRRFECFNFNIYLY